MRIVSLLPSATEILFAIGAGDQVVGVTHECDFPEEARTRPQLTASALPPSASAAEIDRHVRRSVHAGSSLYTLDAERLEELRPDLIVTQELCAVCAVSYGIVTDAVRRSHADPRIMSLEPSSLDDVFTTIATLGDVSDCAPAASGLIASLRERIARLEQQVANRPRPRTLVLEWTDPPMSGGHWTPGLVEIAGGTPILAHPGANSQTIPWEAIEREDPDRVIVAPCGFDMAATLRAMEAVTDPVWHRLRARLEGNLVAMDGNAFVNRPGPRLVDTAEIFAMAIHPALRAASPFSEFAYSAVRA